MTKNKSTMINGYYFITDSSLSTRGSISDVKNAIKAGVTAIQYREKNADTGKMYREAMAIKKICMRVGARRDGPLRFIINDRIDIALAVDADGVHIGQSDIPYKVARKILGPKKIIGVSVNNLRQAVLAEKMGADYLGVGPIFKTSTKHDAGKPLGLTLIKKIRKKCRIPIVAIGGISLYNAKNVLDAGADAVCAISAVVTNKNVRSEIDKFQGLFIQ